MADGDQSIPRGAARCVEVPVPLIQESVTAQIVILEAALHACIAQRCERAYAHDLRNGLQSIYASVDVLTRMLAGKSAPTLSQDKVADMARKAINAYEQSLNHVAKRLIVQSDTPQAVNVDAALQELCAFLRNDATARPSREFARRSRYR